MRDRSMRSGTKLAREIQLTDWSTAGNLSNRSSGVQIPRDICTCFGRYLYSTKGSWIINVFISIKENQISKFKFSGIDTLWPWDKALDCLRFSYTISIPAINQAVKSPVHVGQSSICTLLSNSTTRLA